MTHDTLFEILLDALRMYADCTIQNDNPAVAEWALDAWEDYNRLNEREVDHVCDPRL